MILRYSCLHIFLQSVKSWFYLITLNQENNCATVMRAGSSERGGRGKDARINVIGLLYVKILEMKYAPKGKLSVVIWTVKANILQQSMTTKYVHGYFSMHRSDTFISKNIGIQAVLKTLSETKNLQCPLLIRRPASIPIYHLYGRPPPPRMTGWVLVPAWANLSSCKDKSGRFFLFRWRNYRA